MINFCKIAKFLNFEVCYDFFPLLSKDRTEIETKNHEFHATSPLLVGRAAEGRLQKVPSVEETRLSIYHDFYRIFWWGKKKYRPLKINQWLLPSTKCHETCITTLKVKQKINDIQKYSPQLRVAQCTAHYAHGNKKLWRLVNDNQKLSYENAIIINHWRPATY